MERCRESGVSFENYAFHERRKSFQGFFDGVEFFVRYVKDWGEFREIYGECSYTTIGRARLRARIIDGSDCLFTPCFYGVDNIQVVKGVSTKPLRGIASFRGRFCQQAFVGEYVEASGKLEKVMRRDEIYYRLIIGNRSEDFMVTVR